MIYPRLATDYHVVGRHDIAIAIIEKTVQGTRSLLKRWESSVHVYAAEICNDIVSMNVVIRYCVTWLGRDTMAIRHIVGF